MQGSFAREDVVSVATRVMVGSASRPFVSVDLSGSTSGSSPVGSGVYRRSGTVTFQHLQAVMERPEAPFARSGGWPPSRGDRLQVWYDVTLTDGSVVPIQRVQARVDDVRMGDLIEVDFVENWDAFRTGVTVDPMMRVMPGARLTADTASPRYPARIEPIGPVYRALEQAGHGILPRPVHPSGARVLVHASWQGAMVPTTGGVVSMGDAHITPDMLWYIDQATVREPFTFGTSPGLGTDNIGIWIRASRETWAVHGAAYAAVVLRGGTSEAVVQVGPTSIGVYLDGVQVASSPMTYAPGDPIGVALLWTSTNVRIYETGTQTERVVPVAAPPPSLSNVEVETRWTAAVRVTRGEQPTNWSRANLSLQHGPVEFVRPFWGGGLDASRLIESATAEDVLTEYADRQLAYVWQDETGRLRIWGADAIRAQSPARTYTERDLLSEIVWSESWRGVRSSVAVEYLRAAITNSALGTTTLWQGSASKRLLNGDQDQEIAAPAGDEDWVEPDFNFQSAASSPEGFNSGQGSWWSAVRDTGGGVTYWAHEYTALTVEQISRSKVLISHAVTGLPAGVVILATPTEETSTAVLWRNVPMPIVRGRGRITWSDVVTASAMAGPTWAPQYVHDLSWWGRPADALRARDWLMPILTTPPPVLDSLRIRLDPQLQRGDVIRLDLTKSQGVTVTALVEDIAEQVDYGDHSMTITVRVLTTSTPALTYAQFALEQGDTTYTEFQTQQGSTTYTDFQTQQSGG